MSLYLSSWLLPCSLLVGLEGISQAHQPWHRLLYVTHYIGLRPYVLLLRDVLSNIT